MRQNRHQLYTVKTKRTIINSKKVLNKVNSCYIANIYIYFILLQYLYSKMED